LHLTNPSRKISTESFLDIIMLGVGTYGAGNMLLFFGWLLKDRHEQKKTIGHLSQKYPSYKFQPGRLSFRKERASLDSTKLNSEIQNAIYETSTPFLHNITVNKKESGNEHSVDHPKKMSR
jgi:hypothetical protein